MDKAHWGELSRRIVAHKRLLRLIVSFHVFVYRLTRGYLGGKLGELSVLLLTTRGRLSGIRRTVPLCYLPLSVLDSEGNKRSSLLGYAVVGSFGGSPHAPTWVLNLRACPAIEVELGSDRLSLMARLASPEERVRLWDQFCQRSAHYRVYQAATSRIIPIYVLEPY